MYTLFVTQFPSWSDGLYFLFGVFLSWIESCDFLVLIGDPSFFLFVLFCLASRVERERWTIILYLSPLSEMSPAMSDCLEPYFSGVFLFFSNYRVCVDFSGSFYLFFIFSTMCTLSG